VSRAAARTRRSRRSRRNVKLPIAPPIGVTCLRDAREIARFLKEQPPIPVPPRTLASSLPGLLALSLLGAQIVSRDAR
jgi:hypothetical protein